MIALIRAKREFIITSLLLSFLIFFVTSVRQEAIASLISSKLSSENEVAKEDLEAVQKFLEQKIVIQKLHDFGMIEEEAIAKVKKLDSADLHIIASLINCSPAGGTGTSNDWPGRLAEIEEDIKTVSLVVLAAIIVLLLIAFIVLRIKSSKKSDEKKPEIKPVEDSTLRYPIYIPE